MSRRILISVDQLRRAHPGGIGTYVRGLLGGLSEIQKAAAEPFEIVGVAPRGPSPDPLSSLGVELCSSRLSERVTSRLWARYSLGVPRNANVVHASSMAGPWRGGARGAVHSVLVHDVLWRDHPELTTARGTSFHESRLRMISERTDVRVLVTSNALADRLAHSEISRERIHVVRLGVDRHSPGAARMGREDILRRFGLSEVLGASGNYTIVVGTVQPRKNLRALIDAHSRARAVEPDLGPLIVAGARGWGDVDLTGAIALGAVEPEPLAGLVDNARVAAFVPLEEGWGLPAVEALAAGRPLVVSTGVPSVAQVTCAHHVDPRDSDAITQGLLAAFRESDDEQARDARRAAVSHLTWATCAEDHLAAWS